MHITRVLFNHVVCAFFFFLKLHVNQEYNCFRKLLGENLDGCSKDELRELENKIEKGLHNIRLAKVSCMMKFILYMNHLYFHF